MAPSKVTNKSGLIGSRFIALVIKANAVTRTRWLCFLFQQARAGNAHCAAVVTLGGGSAMDAGKAIAMLAGQRPDASILDFCFCPMLADDQEICRPHFPSPYCGNSDYE